MIPYDADGDGIEGPQPIIIDAELEWEAETILRHYHCRGVQQYLAKYIGHDQSEAMWLEEDELVNVPDILQVYKQQIT